MKIKHILYIALTMIVAACKSQHTDLEKGLYADTDLEKGLYADIATNKGNIIVKLQSEKTPVTVANFVSLSEGNNPMVSEEYKNKKYYDNLVYHRVIADFMIQGGDPTATGSGDPGYQFEDEITDLKHSGPGILSMANAGRPGTNGSQFFITHKATPWLDGKNTVFGQVVKGQEVVDSIAQNDSIKSIRIIRNGSDAKKFDAPKIFLENYQKQVQEKMNRENRIAEIRIKNVSAFDALREKATLTPSGLQYIVTEKGNGAAVKSTFRAKAHYAVYFVDGTLLDTSILEVAEANEMVNSDKKNADAYQPIDCDVTPNGRMIPGFKEGLQLLNVGDKATLFLPYTLAYGERGSGPIPPQSDLIFQVEITELME